MTRIQELCERLADQILDQPRSGRRRLVGIAGAPASGKSTLSEALTETLVRRGCTARCVPMDGFHLDNRILDEMGLRTRKGAPETFDADGFLNLIRRLSAENRVYYPVFDRGRDLAIAGAGVVGPDCDTVVVEGNYLLFDAHPWKELAGMWDLSIWVNTPEATILERCIQRWLDHGHTKRDARARAEGNDLRNARLVAGHRLGADVVVSER